MTVSRIGHVQEMIEYCIKYKIFKPIRVLKTVVDTYSARAKFIMHMIEKYNIVLTPGFVRIVAARLNKDNCLYFWKFMEKVSDHRGAILALARMHNCTTELLDEIVEKYKVRSLSDVKVYNTKVYNADVIEWLVRHGVQLC
jgi:hypothetical protein